jgi:hypothetical protein
MRVALCALLTGMLLLSASLAVLAADDAAPAAALAPVTADDAGASPVADCSLARVMDCCHPIRVLQGCLKYKPRCIDLEHLCLTPYAPCPAEICPTAACHKPLTPCAPDGCAICLPRACHKPLTVFWPTDICPPKCDDTPSDCSDHCATGESSSTD